MSHMRLEIDEYTLDFGCGRFTAKKRGQTCVRNLTGDNLVLSLMMRCIELQRNVACANRSRFTPEEWLIAEQRAGEARMETDDAPN